RTILAPAGKVFDAWLNPKTPGTPWHEGDERILNPKVDGLFYWLIMGTSHYGRFTKLKRPRLIQHTWMSKNTLGEESIVTVAFKGKGVTTLMTLVHSDIPDTPGGKSHDEGWKYFLDQFVDHFAGNGHPRK